MKTSDRVLVIVGVFILCFVVSMIIIFCVKGSVPDELIRCTLGAGGFEAFFLAWIKVKKISKDKDDNKESEDDAE